MQKVDGIFGSVSVSHLSVPELLRYNEIRNEGHPEETRQKHNQDSLDVFQAEEHRKKIEYDCFCPGNSSIS